MPAIVQSNKPRRRRVARQREGAVMLVVLLILLVATASAAVSVETTQSELEASGHDRISLQARYASEAAIMTSIAWIDMLGDSGQWRDIWEQWEAGPPPSMAEVGEPEVTNHRHHATRSTLQTQLMLQADGVYGCPNPDNCLPPLNQPTATTGGDAIGAFGPYQSYEAANNYVVDINDCRMAPTAEVPGAPIGGGPGSLKVVQFLCTVTARGRLEVPGGTASRQWDLPNNEQYDQPEFAALHESRAEILTPQMIVPAE